ncbi:unnamed protein product, partial [Heterosigma akashiwo]
MGAVEALEFVEGWEHRENQETQPLHLIVGVRDSVDLVYINCQTQEQRNISINDSDWDTHVSFNILHLTASPDSKFLLASTDKSRLIVYPTGSNRQLISLYGHTTDDYFNPRGAWHPSGKYVYANSQAGNSILCWSLESKEIVARLCGHDKLVRDIGYHPSLNLLVSASYDGSVKIW